MDDAFSLVQPGLYADIVFDVHSTALLHANLLQVYNLSTLTKSDPNIPSWFGEERSTLWGEGRESGCGRGQNFNKAIPRRKTLLRILSGLAR